jgi:hypothetical protein
MASRAKKEEKCGMASRAKKEESLTRSPMRGRYASAKLGGCIETKGGHKTQTKLWQMLFI